MTSARPDTRYLATSPITTDLSQRLTNLTADGATGYEDNSARTAIAGDGAGRSIELSIEFDNTYVDTIFDIGSDSGSPLAKIEASTGSIVFKVGATTIATIAAPNVSGTAQTYIVGWSSEPNPQTTGASDAIRSEVFVYDVSGDAMVYAVATHATGSPVSTMALAVGGQFNGANVINKWGGTINAVRVSARFHSRAETREHFVAQTSTPTVNGVTALEQQVIPADACVAGSIVGPQAQHASSSLYPTASRFRLLGPVVNAQIWSPPNWTSDPTDTVGANWVRSENSGRYTHIAWLGQRRVPLQADWVLAQAQWATWNTAAEAVDVDLSLFCSSKPPQLATVQDYSVTTITRTTDDGAGGGTGGTGILEYFSPLIVHRDDAGWSWLWLAVLITEETPQTTVMNLRQISIVAMAQDADEDLQPAPWGG